MIRSILNSSKLFYLLVPAVVVVGVVLAVVSGLPLVSKARALAK